VSVCDRDEGFVQRILVGGAVVEGMQVESEKLKLRGAWATRDRVELLPQLSLLFAGTLIFVTHPNNSLDQSRARILNPASSP
jgi:hypothetical protein